MANNSHAHPQHDTQTFHHRGEKREKRRQAKLAGSVSCATGPAICNIGRRNVADANLVRGSPVMPCRVGEVYTSAGVRRNVQLHCLMTSVYTFGHHSPPSKQLLLVASLTEMSLLSPVIRL